MKAATYSTGLPCKHGHLADRYVSSKACCECDRLKHKKYKGANPDKVHAQRAAWCAANPDYAYCQIKISLETKHVDHIQPLARGGHNGRSNLQMLCRSCNVRKNDIEPIEYARRIGRLL